MLGDRVHQSSDAVRIRSMRRCLEHRNLGFLRQSLDLEDSLSENMPPGWLDQSRSPPASERLALLRHAVLDGSNSATTEIEQEQDGRRFVYELTCVPDLGENGRLEGLITLIADVTEAREREVALASLLREVSHRSKNLLAIVLSIAAQTAHHAGGIEDFLQKFRGRIQALASAQDLVTDNNWLGTPFRSLVVAEVARDGHASPDKIRVSGDNPTLGPNAALHVGLALHELVTNASLHGVLSVEQAGRIRVDAKLEHIHNGTMQLVIDWSEHHLPDHPVPAPHFGTVVLEQVVPRSLGGTAQFEVGEDHVHYRLVVPGDQFTA